MDVEFYKYQGNGNDFVILDVPDGSRPLPEQQIRKICDRHFGVGADGLMVVSPSETADFKMIYYNADGKLSSMCGNGGRCIALYAWLRRLAPSTMSFEAYDGLHRAVVGREISKGRMHDVSLQMADVEEVERNGMFYFLDTGSPHYVEFVTGLSEMDVVTAGRTTRYSERFSPGGTNVNFAEFREDGLFVRTYERGVEDETLSCGTGVTASAIAAFLETGKKVRFIQTTGGNFTVDFEEKAGSFTHVWLGGPAEQVFSGLLDL